MTDYSFWNESDFWIGDIPLNYIDENGCMWMIQDVDGWWELPPPEIPDDTRPYSDDGDYYVSGRYAARTVTIKGRIIPPVTANRQVVTDARDRLSSTLNSVRKTLVFKVMEPRYPKQANVQINSVPTMVINDYNNHVEFTIQFKASDPRKYSAEMHNISAQLAGKSEWGRRYPRQFYYTYGDVPPDGTIYANNNGDYHTYGVIRISGPVTNPSLLHVESNSTLKFNIVLGVDDYLDVNLRARTVRLNGKQFKRSSLTTDSTWFTLGPGENSIRFRGTQHIPAKESKESAINQALNPSFETGVSSTTNVINTNMVRTPRPGGSYNMEITKTGGGTIGSLTSSTSGGPTGINSYATVPINTISTTQSTILYLPSHTVKPDFTYAWSVYVNPSTTVDISPVMVWTGAQGTVRGGVVSAKAGEWTRLTMTSTAENSTVSGRPGIEILANQPTIAGGSIGISGAFLEQSTLNSEFFDGATTNGATSYRWTGTAYRSTSTQYGVKLEQFSTYGSSLVPFQSTVWRQTRASVDPTDNSGYVSAIKPNTADRTSNITFAVPSSQITPDTGEAYGDAILSRIIDVGSQGLMPNTAYTAMVEVVVPDTFKGTYTETSTINYALSPTPDQSYESSWTSFGFAKPLSLQEHEPDPTNGYVRSQILDDITKIAPSGIRYKQNKGTIPEASTTQLSMIVRSNRIVPFEPIVRWYNGASLVRESRGPSVVPDEADQWVTLTVNATSPQVFTRLEFSVELTQAESDATWSVFDYLDARSLMIQSGDNITSEFFDGYAPDTDTEVYSWEGPTGQSESKRVEKTGGEESLHEYARSLVYFSLKGDDSTISGIDPETVVFDKAPNAPGEYLLTIKFTTGTDFLTNSFVSLWNGSPSTSDIIYFDRFAIIEGNYEGNYFDGSYTDARWAGTTNLSQSIQNEVVGVPEAEALIQYRSAWIR